MSFDMMHMPGPCVVCGDTNYTLSCGGPTICAKCDCGNFDAATVMKQAKVIAELREQLAAVSQPEVQSMEAREKIRAHLVQMCLASGDGTYIHHNATEVIDAILSLGVAQALTISVKPMELSDDRTDYFVSISVGDREITPYVFRDEQFKAEYEAASFRWLLLGEPKPDLMAYSEDGWPSLVPSASSGSAAK